MIFEVIVAGGRDFNDYDKLKTTLDNLLSEIRKTHTIKIVSGCANGADKLGEKYAAERGYDVLRYPADWDSCGKSAGFVRNVEMAKNADAAVVFWDGKSTGSKHMIDTAKRFGLTLRVKRY